VIRSGALVVVLACGSAPPPPPPPPPPPVARVATPVQSEQAKHDEIVAAHRKIESDQADALAATCDEPDAHDKHERCLPSCYATEPNDTRAGKKLAGATELQHLACERPDGGYLIADELDAKLAVRAARGRFPKPHKKGSWQADVEAALAEAALPKLPRGDALVVTGAWHDVANPLTHERMRCVAVSQFGKAMHGKLDACGSDGTIACEAAGNVAARGINVVHYRLAEARQLEAANKPTECQQAALEAIAVARGMPRWRQYAKLNAGHWVVHAGYRTRFDGTLDEDALFEVAIKLGGEAEQVYVACGGAAGAPTTVAQEQSFHTCW
jgi:hypothetical protein